MDPVTPTLDAGQHRQPRRRAIWIGSLVAILGVGGLGWLAWDLTRSTTPTGGAGPGGPAAVGSAGVGGPGGLGGPGGAAGPGGRRVPVTTVGTAVAERMDIPLVIDALGTVTPQATVRVKPQVSGVLLQVLFKEGQMVRKGDLLATIDPRLFELALQQTMGQRQRDEAQLEAAKVTLQRFQTLLGQDSIARQEVDTQAALVKQLEGTVMVDRANEGTARLNLGYTRITAPVTGRVGLRTVDVGNVVSPGDTNGVALITQVSPIDVQFAVPQDQAQVLLEGQKAPGGMKVNAYDRTRSTLLEAGVFSSLDNQVDTQTGTVRAKARFANTKEALFPSQFVNVQLIAQTIKDAVVVPVAALRRGSGGDHVFVLGRERSVSMRPVKAGRATVDKVQIVSGLAVGERVVTEGADRLKDGSRVVLPGDTPGSRRPAASAAAGAPGAAGAGSPSSGASGVPAPTGEQRAPAAQGATPSVGGAGAGAAPNRPLSGGAAGAAGAAPAAPTGGLPTAEQRKRMLEQVKDDPEALERRKRFFEALDRGEPAALERWKQLQERRREAGGGSGQ